MSQVGKVIEFDEDEKHELHKFTEKAMYHQGHRLISGLFTAEDKFVFGSHSILVSKCVNCNVIVGISLIPSNLAIKLGNGIVNSE